MMKTFRLLLGFIIIFPMICPAQKKELLIIGTMHTVPYIVKNAYRPLLKYAIDCLYSYMCRPMLQCGSGEKPSINECVVKEKNVSLFINRLKQTRWISTGKNFTSMVS